MNSHDPYTVLGVTSDASQPEITAAYRRAIRACHPDTAQPDPTRLAAVIAAYRALRNPTAREPHRGTEIPVRVHETARQPDLRAGPVRRHSGPRRTPQARTGVTPDVRPPEPR